MLKLARSTWSNAVIRYSSAPFSSLLLLCILADALDPIAASAIESAADLSNTTHSKALQALRVEEAPILLPAKTKILESIEQRSSSSATAQQVLDGLGKETAGRASRESTASSGSILETESRYLQGAAQGFVRIASANSAIQVLIANLASVSSGKMAYVQEPLLLQGLPPPSDAEKIGFGKATLIAYSKWSTIRYLGERPAGYGLAPPEMQAAQRLALGNPNDVLPVTSSAAAIHAMMEEFFAPMLFELPGGPAILQGIHVQGAYVSPTFNPVDGTRLDFDNAFIVGHQSLYIYPSSCYHRPDPELCKPPFLSTGHDATVIGHELGHVIFNSIRNALSPKGFQWFAVNEGYADYFSASFFENPVIGEAWQSSKTSAPYLRRLLDNPNTRDVKVLQSAHAFSVVWSSLLWRIRTRLAQELKTASKEYDTAVLFSIFHLGEGGGNHLGDAATALLKAVYQLGFMKWDKIIREEIARSKIELTPESLEKLPAKPYQNASGNKVNSGSGFGCTVGRLSNAQAPFAKAPFAKAPFDLLGLLLLVPLSKGFSRPKFWRAKNRKSQAPKKCNRVSPATRQWFFLLWTTLFVQACVKKPKPRLMSEIIRPDAKIDYICNLSQFSNATLQNRNSTLSIALALDQHLKESSTILVYDGESADPASAAQVIYDRITKRVDRLLQLDGKPLSTDLVASTVTVLEAERLTRAMIGLLLFEEAPQALAQAEAELASQNTQTNSPAEGRMTAEKLLREGVFFTSAGKFFVNVQFSRAQNFWDLGIKAAEIVQTSGKTLCKLKS